MIIITDCLGRALEVTKTWPDGSYQCPHCCYPVLAGSEGCGNPACFARVGVPYPAEAARECLRRARDRQEEEARRKRDREAALKRASDAREEHAAWQAEQRAEAVKRGACLDCLFQPGWCRVKFVRHRKACPKVRKW